jgi:hypothetical protein
MNPFQFLKRVTDSKPELAVKKDSKFIYKSGSDVLATWRKTGWTPPTEYRTDYEFGKRRV